ncbi:uncharacterized protein [Misgurnus anguillicaudatus]|uniref:uncharacterized protein isoform X1 n=1 Tax=Misgurnus anguillicaudatus TaxID=75329 RepID=UPI003CCFADCF
MCEKAFSPFVTSTPQNTVITFENDQEIQDLLQQLKDAKTEFQRTQDELEQVNKDVNTCREEMDRRMIMMVQMDEGLWNSLLELDSVMLERKSLENQLQELTLSSTIESQQALLSGLQEEKSSLMEQEHNLQLRCEQLRKALEGPSSNIEKDTSFSQSENPTKPDSSSQSKSTVKPVRKRGGRK